MFDVGWNRVVSGTGIDAYWRRWKERYAFVVYSAVGRYGRLDIGTRFDLRCHYGSSWSALGSLHAFSAYWSCVVYILSGSSGRRPYCTSRCKCSPRIERY